MSSKEILPRRVAGLRSSSLLQMSNAYSEGNDYDIMMIDNRRNKGYLRRHVRAFGKRSTQNLVVHYSFVSVVEGR